ncbi:hypothetical protein BJ875DRAFT_45968 [Amylocarpus encephaloides]|uniref:Secreted protein n=1 Tax=Amylocarpus encephaloides TaxID=45428 RepID=A0A9P8C4D5_9HELO|nr:hypothetical protein BJ875DRAFT_45968 [Amylocarpus encephaloides]
MQLPAPLYLPFLLGAVAQAAPLEQAAQAAQAIAAAPAECGARLISMSYSGNGCPQGSASKAYDAAINSNRWFFDGISAEIGRGGDQSDKSTACQVHLQIATNAGWAFTLKGKNSGSNAMTSKVNIGGGVSANYLTTYYFSSDATDTTTVKYSISGPKSGEVTVYDPAPGQNYPRSECGGGLMNINHRVALTSTSTSGAGTMELYGDGGSGPQNSNWVPWGAFEWVRC